MAVHETSGLTTEEVEEAAHQAMTRKWPKMIGIISLLYAVGGLLCAVSLVAWTFVSEGLAAMGGMDLTIPPVIKVTTAISRILPKSRSWVKS